MANLEHTIINSPVLFGQNSDSQDTFEISTVGIKCCVYVHANIEIGYNSLIIHTSTL